MTSLREVLAVFESGQVHSLKQLSVQLSTDPGLLESMLEFWVQKGKLKHAVSAGCAECGVRNTCNPAACASFAGQPLRFELADAFIADLSLPVTAAPAPAPKCSHCG